MEKENEKQQYNFIKAWLAIKNVKAKELAAHLNVSRTTVSKWSTNYSQPSVAELFAIAGFLDISVRELLVDNKNPEPPKLKS